MQAVPVTTSAAVVRPSVRCVALAAAALVVLGGLVVALAGVAGAASTGRYSYDPGTGVLTYPDAYVRAGQPIPRTALLFEHAETTGGRWVGSVRLPARGGAIYLGVIDTCGRGQWDVRNTDTRRHITGRKFDSPAGPCAVPSSSPPPTSPPPTSSPTASPSPSTTRPAAVPSHPTPRSTPAARAITELAYTGASWQLVPFALGSILLGVAGIRWARGQGGQR